MAEITAALVKELREKSGVGMMDCKKALTENDGNIEASLDWLRAKGLSKAAKKADRVAAEGLVAVALRSNGRGMTGAVVELNAETDFVARNEMFQNAARKAAKTALDIQGDVEALTGASTEDGEVLGDTITHLIATIGENMLVRRSKTDPHGTGADIAVWANPAEPLLCPAAALDAWPTLTPSIETEPHEKAASDQGFRPLTDDAALRTF